MSSILNARTLFAGSATALFLGLAMSSAAQASITSKLLKCQAGSRDAAVHCCQEVVNTYGAPSWLGGRDNCNRSVSCGSYDLEKRCRVSVNYQPPTVKNSKTPGGGGHNNNNNNGSYNKP